MWRGETGRVSLSCSSSGVACYMFSQSLSFDLPYLMDAVGTKVSECVEYGWCNRCPDELLKRTSVQTLPPVNPGLAQKPSLLGRR